MQPLAERVRPTQLEDYIGQQHLIGANGPLRWALDQKVIPSLIFWGPPGVGKTSLALLLSKSLNRPFYQLSAVNSGVKDIREVIEKAGNQGLFSQKPPILFIDEIHRFSKSQQDSLLGAVEKGSITLVGATTENPSFEVISALLSRCQVYVLKPLDKADLLQLLEQAIKRDVYLQNQTIILQETDALLRISGGDARKLLNALEIVVNAQSQETAVTITDELVQACIQQNLALYDKQGEQHYDIISAFIKSIRGSDPNAALYYLARMLKGGEDLLFIARRLIILASEDIGNANPNALLLANACFESVNKIGMPEARIILGQCVTYLASSPKSNAAYEAIDKALEMVEKTGDLPVPLPLRNAPTQLMKQLDYGKTYAYAHAYETNFVEQEFMPEAIAGHTFYVPGANSNEAKLRHYLKQCWKEKYGY